MDAVRISDGRVVVLKQVPRSRYPNEEGLSRLLTMSGPLASDRHNHSVLVHEVLQSPLDEDIIFLVMPCLARIYSVKFATVGEAVECFRQLFEVREAFVPVCPLWRTTVLYVPTGSTILAPSSYCALVSSMSRVTKYGDDFVTH